MKKSFLLAKDLSLREVLPEISHNEGSFLDTSHLLDEKGLCEGNPAKNKANKSKVRKVDSLSTRAAD